MRASTALAVYDRHVDALFSLALLLSRDAGRAVDAVVATMTLSCTTASDVTPETERLRLAADLWCRRMSVPAVPDDDPGRGPMSPAQTERAPSEQEQALLGLVLFGCHTYGQVAALVGVPAPSAAMHLRSVLRRAANAPDDRPARSTSTRHTEAKGTA